MPDQDIQFDGSGSGAKLRTYRRGGSSTDRHDWRRIWSDRRLVTYRAGISSFLIIGNGANNANALTANLISCEVGAASPVAVAIRHMALLTDVTILQTSVLGQFKTYRLSGLPSGGAALDSSPFDSNLTGSADVVWRCTNSADGSAPLTGGSALSWTTADLLWQQFSHRLHSAIRESRADDNSMLPISMLSDPLILAPGEAIGVQYEGPQNGWRSTSSGIVVAVFEEFTAP